MDSTTVMNNNTGKRLQFSWHFFPGFLSTLSLLFCTLIVIANQSFIPHFTLSLSSVSQIELFFIRLYSYIPYFLLASVVLSFITELTLISKFRDRKIPHRRVAILGSSLFSLFLGFPFLPDIIFNLDPAISLQTHIFTFIRFMQFFPIILTAYLILTIFLGTFLITVVTGSRWRIILPMVAIVLLVFQIMVIWGYYMTVPSMAAFPTLNTHFFNYIGNNYESFVVELTGPKITGYPLIISTAYVYALALLLLCVTFFPVFGRRKVSSP